MREEYPVKEKDFTRIKRDFRSIRFPCIRCGSKDIEIVAADPQNDDIIVRGIRPPSPTKHIELTFYVAGILFCRKCNHRFHVKILDQGISNTNVYFDNRLA
jgi:transcription elongation factor Elf1